MPSIILDAHGRPYSSPAYGTGTPGGIYAPATTENRLIPEHPDCFGDFSRLLPRYPWRRAVSDCRWIAASFSLVAGAAEQKADYVAASHFATYYTGDDDAWGEEAEEVLEQYDGICTSRSPLFDWASFWRCGILNLIDSGSFFIHLTVPEGADPRDPTARPILQPFESHRIGSLEYGEETVKGGPFDGARILNGIIYNRSGNEIGYRVLGTEQGQYTDVSARDMVHVPGRPRYFSQNRPLPQIAPALKDLAMVLDTRDSEQIAQNVNSRLTLIEKNETGKRNAATELVNPQPKTAAGTPTEVVEKGFYRTVKNGGSLEAHESTRPSGEWQRFDDKITASALFGMRWRVEMLDLSKLTGGGIRGFADNINTAIMADFGGITRAMLRCRRYQVARHQERGDIRKSDTWWRWAAQPPAEFTADPGRQISSEIEAVRAGAQSMPDVHRRWGTRSKYVIRETVRYETMKRKAATAASLPLEALGTTAMPGDPVSTEAAQQAA